MEQVIRKKANSVWYHLHMEPRRKRKTKLIKTDTTKIWSDRPVLQPSEWPVLQLHVTAQFYLESKGKHTLEAWGHVIPKDVKRRKASSLILASFYMFFLLSLGLPYVNWASQGCCLFYLWSSLWSSDLPVFYFRRPFPPLSFIHRRFGLLFLF